MGVSVDADQHSCFSLGNRRTLEKGIQQCATRDAVERSSVRERAMAEHKASGHQTQGFTHASKESVVAHFNSIQPFNSIQFNEKKLPKTFTFVSFFRFTLLTTTTQLKQQKCFFFPLSNLFCGLLAVVLVVGVRDPVCGFTAIFVMVMVMVVVVVVVLAGRRLLLLRHVALLREVEHGELVL